MKEFIVLKTSAAILNSECMFNGMLEGRVLELFNLLKDKKNVILFIDEIHTLIGAGSSSTRQSSDIANMIKPFITSDNIHLVGATTDYEYERYIQYDMAFSRRFSCIQIEEPSNEALDIILKHTITKYSKLYNVKVSKETSSKISSFLVANTDKTHRNIYDMQYNPDLSISIIAKAFGYARLYDKEQLSEQEFMKAYNSSNKIIKESEIIDNNKIIRFPIALS